MKSKYRKYNNGGPVKPKKRKSPLQKYLEEAPDGIRIVDLKYGDDGMDVFTLSNGHVIKQKHSQSMGYPYDAGDIQKVYNDRTQYENALKSFRDSLSLANFSSDGMFPIYDSDWQQSGRMAGQKSFEHVDEIEAKRNLAEKIVKNSKGSIKAYYPGDEPGYFMYGYPPILRWSDDPNKKVDGYYRGGGKDYYGYDETPDPYKRTGFLGGNTLMYNENTDNFTIPIDSYETKKVPMGEGNHLQVTYKNERGEEATLLKKQKGGDYLITGKIIETANEAGRRLLDEGYHRAEYPDFAPPKVRPVYREPVSKITSLKPKPFNLKPNIPQLKPINRIPDFYSRKMNRFGDIIYDTSFGQFITTKDPNQMGRLRAKSNRYRNSLELPPMLDQDFQNMFRNQINQGVRDNRVQFKKNIDIIDASPYAK